MGGAQPPEGRAMMMVMKVKIMAVTRILYAILKKG
jgi:hypothetical protein